MTKKEKIQKWELDEGVLLSVNKAPGEGQANIQASFTTGVAAARGIALMMIEAAERMGVPVEHLLCVVTTILMAEVVKPDATDSQAHGSDDG